MRTHASCTECSRSNDARSSAAEATRNAYSLRPTLLVEMSPHASGWTPLDAPPGPLPPFGGGQPASSERTTATNANPGSRRLIIAIDSPSGSAPLQPPASRIESRIVVADQLDVRLVT